MIVKCFRWSAILNYQVALFLAFTFDPFSYVSWTVANNCYGWNTLKTTFTFLNEKNPNLSVTVISQINVHSGEFLEYLNVTKRKENWNGNKISRNYSGAVYDIDGNQVICDKRLSKSTCLSMLLCRCIWFEIVYCFCFSSSTCTRVLHIYFTSSACRD